MATLETQHLDEVIASSRRRMLTLGGAALAGLALTSMAKAQSTTTLTDADYLNFALNLEYLEAEFYTLATSGQTIDQLGLGINGTGTQGTVTTKAGGPKSCLVPFKNTLVMNYAMETAKEERNHVTFLRGALNATTPTAVAQPAIDLYNSFNYLGGLLGLGLTSFDPFADDASFLLGAYIFEDVGVTAYTGAAPALTNSGNLAAAAGIQAVEAYHAGLVRTTLFGLDQSANPIAGAGMSSAPAGTLRAVATAISKLRATVDKSTLPSTYADGDDIGLGTQQVMLNGTTNVTATTLVDCSTTGSINAPVNGTTTANSQVFARTAGQVLNIVYAGGTASSNKGFFPAGLNGNVK